MYIAKGKSQNHDFVIATRANEVESDAVFQAALVVYQHGFDSIQVLVANDKTGKTFEYRMKVEPVKPFKAT